MNQTDDLETFNNKIIKLPSSDYIKSLENYLDNKDKVNFIKYTVLTIECYDIYFKIIYEKFIIKSILRNKQSKFHFLC